MSEENKKSTDSEERVLADGTMWVNEDGITLRVVKDGKWFNIVFNKETQQVVLEKKQYD